MSLADLIKQFKASRPPPRSKDMSPREVGDAVSANYRDWQRLERVLQNAGLAFDEVFRWITAVQDLVPSARWKGATTGGTGTIQTLEAFNIAEVTAAAGSLTLEFESPLQSANYSIAAMATDGSELSFAAQAEAVGSFQLRARNAAGTAGAGTTINWLTTNRQICVTVFGRRTF